MNGRKAVYGGCGHWMGTGELDRQPERLLATAVSELARERLHTRQAQQLLDLQPSPFARLVDRDDAVAPRLHIRSLQTLQHAT